MVWEGVRGYGFYGDVALDNVVVRRGACGLSRCSNRMMMTKQDDDDVISCYDPETDVTSECHARLTI